MSKHLKNVVITTNSQIGKFRKKQVKCSAHFEIAGESST